MLPMVFHSSLIVRLHTPFASSLGVLVVPLPAVSPTLPQALLALPSVALLFAAVSQGLLLLLSTALLLLLECVPELALLVVRHLEHSAVWG